LIAGIFVPETPAGLAIQGNLEEAHSVLIKLRTSSSNSSSQAAAMVEAEFLSIKADADRIRHLNIGLQWKTFLSRPYRGELTVAIFVAFVSKVM